MVKEEYLRNIAADGGDALEQVRFGDVDFYTPARANPEPAPGACPSSWAGAEEDDSQLVFNSDRKSPSAGSPVLSGRVWELCQVFEGEQWVQGDMLRRAVLPPSSERWACDAAVEADPGVSGSLGGGGSKGAGVVAGLVSQRVLQEEEEEGPRYTRGSDSEGFSPRPVRRSDREEAFRAPAPHTASIARHPGAPRQPPRNPFSPGFDSEPPDPTARSERIARYKAERRQQLAERYGIPADSDSENDPVSKYAWLKQQRAGGAAAAAAAAAAGASVSGGAGISEREKKVLASLSEREPAPNSRHRIAGRKEVQYTGPYPKATDSGAVSDGRGRMLHHQHHHQHNHHQQKQQQPQQQQQRGKHGDTMEASERARSAQPRYAWEEEGERYPHTAAPPYQPTAAPPYHQVTATPYQPAAAFYQSTAAPPYHQVTAPPYQPADAPPYQASVAPYQHMAAPPYQMACDPYQAVAAPPYQPTAATYPVRAVPSSPPSSPMSPGFSPYEGHRAKHRPLHHDDGGKSGHDGAVPWRQPGYKHVPVRIVSPPQAGASTTARPWHQRPQQFTEQPLNFRSEPRTQQRQQQQQQQQQPPPHYQHHHHHQQQYQQQHQPQHQQQHQLQQQQQHQQQHHSRQPHYHAQAVAAPPEVWSPSRQQDYRAPQQRASYSSNQTMSPSAEQPEHYRGLAHRHDRLAGSEFYAGGPAAGAVRIPGSAGSVFRPVVSARRMAMAERATPPEPRTPPATTPPRASFDDFSRSDDEQYGVGEEMGDDIALRRAQREGETARDGRMELEADESVTESPPLQPPPTARLLKSRKAVLPSEVRRQQQKVPSDEGRARSGQTPDGGLRAKQSPSARGDGEREYVGGPDDEGDGAGAARWWGERKGAQTDTHGGVGGPVMRSSSEIWGGPAHLSAGNLVRARPMRRATQEAFLTTAAGARAERGMAEGRECERGGVDWLGTDGYAGGRPPPREGLFESPPEPRARSRSVDWNAATARVNVEARPGGPMWRAEAGRGVGAGGAGGAGGGEGGVGGVGGGGGGVAPAQRRARRYITPGDDRRASDRFRTQPVTSAERHQTDRRVAPPVIREIMSGCGL
ncbi:uncharacterized protein LOC144938100 [Lampetra fluviatilis]